MLTKQQYYITQLMSECAEVIHACTKLMQFGAKDKGATNGLSNEENLNFEINDLTGALEKVFESGLVLTLEDSMIDAKRKKIEHYLKYSQSKNITEADTYGNQDMQEPTGTTH